MKTKSVVQASIINKNYKSNLNIPSGNVSKLGKAGDRIYEIVNLLDLFGKPITLRYNNNDNFKSFLGGIMTIMVVLSIVVYFLFAVFTFLSRSSPIYSSITEKKSTPDDLDLRTIETPVDWTVGLDIFDENMTGSVFDLTVFSVELKRVSESGGVINKESTYDSIEVDCSSSPAFTAMSDHKKKDEETGKITTIQSSYYDIFKMKNDKGNETAYCFKLNSMMDYIKNQTIPTVLSGSSTTENQEFMSLTVKICNNDTLPDGAPPCKSLEEIKSKIDFYQVRYYFTHHVFVATDKLEHPVLNSTMFFQFPIQKFFSKTYDLFVQKNLVKDTWNVLKTNATTKSMFSYSSNDLGIDFISGGIDPEKHLLKINIKIDSQSVTYIRKFQNIVDFFVSVAGILNGLWAGGKGAGAFLNGMLLRVDLITKSFFLVNDDKSGEEDNMSGSVKTKNLKVELSGMPKDPNSQSIDKKLINKENNFQFEPIDGDVTSQLDEEINDPGVNKNNSSKKLKSVFNQSRSNNSKGDQSQSPAGMLINPYYNDDTLIMPPQPKKFDKFKMSFKDLIYQMIPCCTKNNKPLLIKKKIFEECGNIMESYLNIERIIPILREYEDLKSVILTTDEFSILKQLTFPKIEIVEEEINIRKVEKLNMDDKQIKKNYNQFVQNVNNMIKSPYLSNIENNLLEIHRNLHVKH